MIVIGITGGTGAGKTTALNAIAAMGGRILDCDAIYHQLTQTSRPMLEEISARFPGTVVDGVLQRKLLGKQVFADETALQDLNAITHRYVYQAVEQELAQWEAAGDTLAAIDAIALVESGLTRLCSFTAAVTAPADIRASRIMAREGIDYDYAMLRIRAQKDDDWFRSRCDYLLVNDFDHAEDFETYCRDFFTEKVSVYHE